MAPSPVDPSLPTLTETTTPTSNDYNKDVKEVVEIASVPIIDLSGLDGSIEDRKSTIQAISIACEKWGFFQVVNHGIKATLMEDMLNVMQGFFALPPEEKIKYGTYTKDCTKSVLYEKQEKNGKELFRHLVYTGIEDYWPENPPNYRQVVKEYFEEVWKMSLRIVGAISEGLGLETDYIEKKYGKGCQIGALHHYPAVPDPSMVSPLSPHTDSMALAILMQNDVNGLQMLHDDKWLVIQPVPESFTINVGDCIEILSNGKYKSIVHQGVCNTERSRFSVAAGYGPEFTTIIEPASELVDEMNEPKYKPMMFKDYMAHSHAKNWKHK